MTIPQPRSLAIAVNGLSVSGLLLAPPRPAACYVFAHGAGAGMQQPFMSEVAKGLSVRNVATLRYQFPYMEAGSRRPDVPTLCHATVRAAAAAAAGAIPDAPLIAGGKSFGGRMTSQAQAIHAIAGVRGLAFLGFPLHPEGKPSVTRAQHLKEVKIPMLFMQGTNDKLADLGLFEPIIANLGSLATLVTVPMADHSFHVQKRSGTSDSQVLDSLLDQFADWLLKC